ncbi:MAG: hypothetical protein ACRDVW_00270, partial [Acidimicrobiales bacterium]
MLFSQVSLPDLARISKRAVFGSLAVGIVGLVACVLLGAALVGLGLCIGIALGVANFRMVQGSVVKAGRRPGPKRRPLALNTVSRLAIITAVALGLLFVSFNLGFGVMAGLAVFQFLLLFAVIRSIIKSGAVAEGFGGGSLLGGIG